MWRKKRVFVPTKTRFFLHICELAKKQGSQHETTHLWMRHLLFGVAIWLQVVVSGGNLVATWINTSTFMLRNSCNTLSTHVWSVDSGCHIVALSINTYVECGIMLQLSCTFNQHFCWVAEVRWCVDSHCNLVAPFSQHICGSTSMWIQ